MTTMKKILSIIIMLCMFVTMSFATADRVSAESIDGSAPADEAVAAEDIASEDDSAAAEDTAAAEETAAADESAVTGEAAAGDNAAGNAVSAKGYSSVNNGTMKAFQGGTSPSQAQSISFGQIVSGTFTARETYAGSGSYYMEEQNHYYKFRTGSTAGASYVVKAEYPSYTGKRDSYGIFFELYDSNYNTVRFDDAAAPYCTYTTTRLLPSEAGTMTYKKLAPNTDYYIKVNNSSGYDTLSRKYNVTVTTSGSGSQTPSLITPTVTLDKTRIVTADADSVYVTGRVSYACGQNVAVYDSTGKIAYNYMQLGNSNRSESFRIKVYSRYLNNGTNYFTVRSLPVRNVVNSSNLVNLTVVIGKETESTAPGTNNNQGHSTWYPVYKVTVNGSVYEILQHKQVGGPAARLVKAKNAKSMTIPATVSYKGVRYDVKGIQPNAFKGSKAKTVTIKTRMLSKSSVKKSLQGSSVKTIKVNTVNKKLSKSFVKKYKKFFTKSNCGKKVKVKR